MRILAKWLFVLTVTIATLGGSASVGAATQMGSGDVDVTAKVLGPPPAIAPTITQPTNGQSFDTKSITVAGGCIAGLTVKVFSNGIFVGSALCDGSNAYGLQIDLFVDRNDLMARQYDADNQASPDSSIVTVHYVPPTPPAGSPSSPSEGPIAEFQLVIDYDYTSQAVLVNTPFRLPVHFVGGTGPYEVSIDWGDGSSDAYTRTNTDRFTVEYTYTHVGIYKVVIKVTDSKGQQAHLQFIIRVYDKDHLPGGGPTVPGEGSTTPCGCSILTYFWLFVVGLIVGIIVTILVRYLSLPRTSKKEEKN